MTKLRGLMVVVLSMLLLACSSNPQQSGSKPTGNSTPKGAPPDSADTLFTLNKKSSGRDALEIPPDLLSTTNAKVRTNSVAGAVRVLPEVIGATIKGSASRSWLEIDANAEVVWQKLSEFWAFQEIELTDYRPEAGLMETDWFTRAGKSAGGNKTAASILKQLVARNTALNKFTLRLERLGESQTTLFVSHRAREKIAKPTRSKSESTIYEWVERAQDPEKVAQLLQTLVLLFAASEGELSDSAAPDGAPG